MNLNRLQCTSYSQPKCWNPTFYKTLKKKRIKLVEVNFDAYFIVNNYLFGVELNRNEMTLLSIAKPLPMAFVSIIYFQWIMVCAPCK